MTDLRDYTIKLLTMEDVENLRKNPSPTLRAQIASKVSANYVKNKFSKNQSQIADDIFRMLMLDNDGIVRESLAVQLKDGSNVPKDIVLTLANDKSDAVALPMLLSSNLLHDADLVKIVKNSENTTRQIAISKRDNVSATVSQALVETDNTKVINSLLDNKSATVSEESFETIMQDYGNDSNIAKQLAVRSSNHFLNMEERSVELAINSLMRNNKLTPSIVIEVLCMGNSTFFEMSLSKLLGIEITMVQDILEKKGKDGFEILYAKAMLPENMKKACYLLYSIIKEMEASGEKRANKTLKNYLQVVESRIKAGIKTGKIDGVAYILAIIEQKISSESNTSNEW